ncbi:hypothetical protein ADIS_1611 [Lunatimonas lonarensis]|uniref:Uncharacterized protein n=1 Tax=Lunatimonas lonarensis TaxID=1232681 RepID=R7ZV38_9BACT|nr:hypothetical protein ADIS_1611 [Lunatimonas lonarensis]
MPWFFYLGRFAFWDKYILLGELVGVRFDISIICANFDL